MAYDSVRGETVLFGGSDFFHAYSSDETWVLGSAGWEIRDPPQGPSAVGRHAMVFDESRGRIVMYTGATWEWDGFTWTVPPNAGATPPGRLEAGLAYNPGDQTTVLFGGENGNIL